MPELNWIYDEATMIWTAEVDGICAVVTTDLAHEVYLARVEPPEGSPLDLAPATYDSPEEAQNWCYEFIQERFFGKSTEQTPLF